MAWVKTQSMCVYEILNERVSDTPIGRGLPLVELRQTVVSSVVVAVCLLLLPSSSSSVVSSSLEQMLNTFTSISVTVKKYKNIYLTTWHSFLLLCVYSTFQVSQWKVYSHNRSCGVSWTKKDWPDWRLHTHTEWAASISDLGTLLGMALCGRVTPKMGFLEWVRQS